MLARTAHDLGLAAWLGGSLMGAIGLNGGASAVTDRKERTKVADAGWAKWAPVNAAAIVGHLAGGLALVAGNSGRIGTQRGVGRASLIKAGVTAAALGATVYSGILGKKLEEAGPVVADGAVVPGSDTPEDVARVQSRLRVLQWLIPALTAGVSVLASRMGEQQRPNQVAGGLAKSAISSLHSPL